jgi:hypothetical protein
MFKLKMTSCTVLFPIYNFITLLVVEEGSNPLNNLNESALRPCLAVGLEKSYGESVFAKAIFEIDCAINTSLMTSVVDRYYSS